MFYIREGEKNTRKSLAEAYRLLFFPEKLKFWQEKLLISGEKELWAKVIVC